MAVTIAELISKKDEISASKKKHYAIETSIGEIICKLPTGGLVADAWSMTNTMEANKFVILNCCVEPNLKDSQLQKEFGCGEPLDIVAQIFQVGEISKLATLLMELAGFNKDLNHKVIADLKN